MAILRTSPICPHCGKPVSGIYRDQSHLPPEQRLIGDTFLRWDWDSHSEDKCLASVREEKIDDLLDDEEG